MSRILVTGATGFVGRGLTARLTVDKRPFRSAVRAANPELSGDVAAIGDIGPDTDWTAALTGIDTVIHLAGRAHIQTREHDPLIEFRRVNAAGVGRLAQQAEAAGVRRFVLVSSVKAALDVGGRDAVTETDSPKPASPYGISKLEGERALLGAAQTMETVILRPPLVYGPGVGANFLALLRQVDRGIPLPLGSVRNLRSLIARTNLVDAILTAADAPGAAGRTFYVTDAAPLSTPGLIRELGLALGRPARLLPFPPALLRLAATLLGRGEAADSLLGSLVVSGGAFRTATGWNPPIAARAALAEVAAWYKQPQGRS